MELGPEDVSLLERCPHFRGCYVQYLVMGPWNQGMGFSMTPGRSRMDDMGTRPTLPSATVAWQYSCVCVIVDRKCTHVSGKYTNKTIGM